jgi:hypothetical protein
MVTVQMENPWNLDFANHSQKRAVQPNSPFHFLLMSSPEIAIHKIYRYGKKRKSRL